MGRPSHLGLVCVQLRKRQPCSVSELLIFHFLLCPVFGNIGLFSVFQSRHNQGKMVFPEIRVKGHTIATFCLFVIYGKRRPPLCSGTGRRRSCVRGVAALDPGGSSRAVGRIHGFFLSRSVPKCTESAGPHSLCCGRPRDSSRGNR